MLQVSKTKLTSLLAGTAIIFLCACGGGSSGSAGASGAPAQARIIVEPDFIDSGDRTSVEIEISEITVDAIAIKVRFPVGLVYVRQTAFFRIDGELIDTGPDENVADTTSVYLVFYADADDFGSDGRGSLIFDLEGQADVATSRVEVDVDLDNPSISNSTEFSVTTPRFDAQSDDGIRVGEASSSSSSSTARVSDE